MRRQYNDQTRAGDNLTVATDLATVMPEYFSLTTYQRSVGACMVRLNPEQVDNLISVMQDWRKAQYKEKLPLWEEPRS